MTPYKLFNEYLQTFISETVTKFMISNFLNTIIQVIYNLFNAYLLNKYLTDTYV